MKDDSRIPTKKVLFLNRLGTLIRPVSNDILPKDEKDWEFLDNVEEVLAGYLNNDFKLVVAANIPAIGKKLTTLKVQDAICEGIGKKLKAKLGDNFVWYIADSPSSPYYKPSPGVADKLKKEISVDIEESTVIGTTWTDAQFASVINLPFIPANKFFNWSQTFTIFVGFPASRKTTYCKEYHGFDVRVCIEDINKSMSQEFKLEWKRLYTSVEERMITEALRHRLDAIIDRTNLDKKRRRRFVELIYDFKDSPAAPPEAKDIKIVCKHFDMPYKVCMERYLKVKKWTQIEKIEIEDFFERMRIEYEQPSLDEGFDQIVTLSQDFLLELL